MLENGHCKLLRYVTFSHLITYWKRKSMRMVAIDGIYGSRSVGILKVTGLFAVKLFAVGHFTVVQFAVRTFRRTDTSPYGHFALRTLHRKDISP